MCKLCPASACSQTLPGMRHAVVSGCRLQTVQDGIINRMLEMSSWCCTHRLWGDSSSAIGMQDFHKQGEKAEAYDAGHQRMLRGRQGSR